MWDLWFHFKVDLGFVVDWFGDLKWFEEALTRFEIVLDPFTATNAVKFPSTVTQLSWVLPLSYFRAITFLLCRISKTKMNKLGATIVKNQPFQLLWHPFLYLRLKLDYLQSNSVVTRELIPLFYVELPNQHSLQSIQSPLLCGLQYSILWLKKILTGHRFF